MTFKFSLLEKIDEDIEKWGRKAVSLFRLIQNGFIVPKGIVIPTDIFSQYLNGTLDEVVFEEYLSEICTLTFGNNHGELIFRSSANVEGSIDSGYCGIFDSFIQDKSILLSDNVKKVWNSSLRECVRTYHEKTLSQAEIKMAVIIQEMVHGLYSAVIQSYDMINDKNRIILEYNVGMVDSVVNGKENAYLAYIDYVSKIVEYCDHAVQVPEVVIDMLIQDCNKAEKIFDSHVEIEAQITDKMIYYLQVRGF